MYMLWQNIEEYHRKICFLFLLQRLIQIKYISSDENKKSERYLTLCMVMHSFAVLVSHNFIFVLCGLMVSSQSNILPIVVKGNQKCLQIITLNAHFIDNTTGNMFMTSKWPSHHDVALPFVISCGKRSVCYSVSP